jgi:hypothetical protein
MCPSLGADTSPSRTLFARRSHGRVPIAVYLVTLCGHLRNKGTQGNAVDKAVCSPHWQRYRHVVRKTDHDQGPFGKDRDTEPRTSHQC